ncbi:flavodoxin family protein [Ditylenchus destructor]|uniref:Flavodoxin family protein n=1 Tax=Ditylenchus destructor TaxID=166010 RepID=A0AAD4RDW9_9BILA|nr:flavodoxin family protein [Ditylenchus destructor]
MVPPDPAFRREANAPAQLSAVQKVVRYAEKDDLLLYITALFGIIMPALMYFFYKTVHAKFHAYNTKRKQAKRRQMKEKSKTRSVTIYYCGTNSPTKRIAYDLAEQIDQFDPIVSNLSGADVVQKIKSASKVVLLFVVPCGSENNPSEPLSLFLEWLDEIRYEHQVVCAGDNSKDIGIILKYFSANVTTILKQFHYGAYDNDDSQKSASEDQDSSTDDDSDTTG